MTETTATAFHYLDCRIKQMQKKIEDIKKQTAALVALHRIYTENGDAMKRLADVEAWEAYCEASLDLSNQDDVGEDCVDKEVDEYGYPVKLGEFNIT